MRFNTDIPSPWEIEEEKEHKQEKKKRREENPLPLPEILPEEDPKEIPSPEEEEHVVIIDL